MWSYVLDEQILTFDIATNVMIVMRTRRCLRQQASCAGTHIMLRRVTPIVLSGGTDVPSPIPLPFHCFVVASTTALVIMSFLESCLTG